KIFFVVHSVGVCNCGIINRPKTMSSRAFSPAFQIRLHHRPGYLRPLERLPLLPPLILPPNQDNRAKNQPDPANNLEESAADIPTGLASYWHLALKTKKGIPRKSTTNRRPF